MSGARELIEEALVAHGVAPGTELVEELELLIERGQEWWTTEQVAAFAGIKPQSVPDWCSRQGVARQRMAPAVEVRRAKARMPGRGVGGGRPRRVVGRSA